MVPIEIIALVLIILVTLKLILLPKIWMRFVRKIYSVPKILFLVEFILAGLVLYSLLQAGLSIIHILAAIALGALLTGMTMAWFGKETISWADKIIKKDIWKKALVPILIWLGLMIWGLLSLLRII